MRCIIALCLMAGLVGCPGRFPEVKKAVLPDLDAEAPEVPELVWTDAEAALRTAVEVESVRDRAPVTAEAHVGIGRFPADAADLEPEVRDGIVRGLVRDDVSRVIDPVGMDLAGEITRDGGVSVTRLEGTLADLAVVGEVPGIDLVVYGGVRGRIGPVDVEVTVVDEPTKVAAYRQQWESFSSARETYVRELETRLRDYVERFEEARATYEKRGGKYKDDPDKPTSGDEAVWEAERITAAFEKRLAAVPPLPVTPDDFQRQVAEARQTVAVPGAELWMTIKLRDLRSGELARIDDLHVRDADVRTAVLRLVRHWLLLASEAPPASPAD